GIGEPGDDAPPIAGGAVHERVDQERAVAESNAKGRRERVDLPALASGGSDITAQGKANASRDERTGSIVALGQCSVIDVAVPGRESEQRPRLLVPSPLRAARLSGG